MISGTDPLLAEAQRLYSQPRGGFVAARNARAAELKKQGDAELAASVAAFVKPSAAAEAINRLSGAHADLLTRVLALGREFRTAQSGADRAAIRALGRDRNRLLTEVVAAVATDTDGAAEKLSATAVDEIRRTVLAAVADAGAAEAIRSGRLVRSLAADGISAVDLDGAIAGPAIDVPRPPSDGGPAPIDTSLALRRAKRELQAAEAAARSAAELRAEAAEHKRAARIRRDEARAALADAEKANEVARTAAETARRADDAAQEALRDARASLDELSRS
ncbi:hypothetical protein HQQ81_09030 [Microbacteriaceae bacterium VKM Ac-2854]|nr:hypothetical protein [Microbacteriaceae bacterium VKM Ac-2854]